MNLLAALQQLLDRSAEVNPDDLPELADSVASLVDADSVTIFLADLRQRTLNDLAGHEDHLAVDGTVAGRAFRWCQPEVVHADDRSTWWVPLSDGAERLGVLRIIRADRDESVQRAYAELARHLAGMVSRGRLYGDGPERARRRMPMLIPAELIRAQLPPLSCATSETAISGILEPCYMVGGDAFDYAVNGDIVHLALFDAVGHGAEGGMRAAVLASVALAAYRNARRSGLSLVETYEHVDTAVRDHDQAGLITGAFAELNQATGDLEVISAGHPAGLVFRDGAVVLTLPTPTALPVTMGDLQTAAVVRERLQPGDHLLLYTDGITEARDPRGALFGEERLADFMIRSLAEGMPVAETSRRLIALILDHQTDQLQDDATVLLVHWTG